MERVRHEKDPGEIYQRPKFVKGQCFFLQMFKPPWHTSLHTDIIIMLKPDISYLGMKTLIEVHREGKYFVAIDLLTNVADQGLTEQEALQNLKKGLEEHYQLMIELTPRDRKLTFLDIEVDSLVKNSSAVSS